MAEEKFYKNTVVNVLKILKCLKMAEKEENDVLTVSKISKMTKLHKWTVSRTLDLYMHPFVEIVIPEGFEDVGLQIKFIRLKDPGIPEKRVLDFLRFSKTLKKEGNLTF
jgi:hypothetical protein